jgi:hypothetical protein
LLLRDPANGRNRTYLVAAATPWHGTHEVGNGFEKGGAFMKWLLRFVLVAVIFSAGFAACYARDHFAFRRQLAGMLLSGQSPNCRNAWLLVEGLPHHADVLRSVYESRFLNTAALAMQEPWSPQQLPLSEWGVAYGIMRNPQKEDWPWHEGMTDIEQDVMIRYLCFRIQTWAYNGLLGCPGNELFALKTYSAAARIRNAGLLTETFAEVLDSPFDSNLSYAADFLVEHVSEEWVESLIVNLSRCQISSHQLGGNGLQRSRNFMKVYFQLLSNFEGRDCNKSRALFEKILADPEARRHLGFYLGFDYRMFKSHVEARGFVIEDMR